ncbi:putative MFS-type transporter YfiS [Micromonospora saelicesensis]|uniref:Putative MFS-type transporter YfiS n=1 Tax=Micromonospora saelicesensis TaxID=285676 RepID=A0A328NKA7_9ACTN|nr:MFS transporter [Micromonospora saelicesensis]RAO29645.1 putative MFS-type transporter YfiS [Micromonospora saelicesensis]
MSFTTDESRWSDVWIAAAARGTTICGDFLAATALALALQGAGAGGLAVSGLLLAATLPLVVLAPLAGRLADRTDSRTLLVTIGFGQAAICALLAVVEQPVLVVGLVALLACGLAVTQPCLAALLPAMVRPADLPRASAISQTAVSLGALGGPVLAGLLVGQFGTRVPLLLDAVTYLALVVAGLLLRTRRGGRRPATASPATAVPATAVPATASPATASGAAVSPAAVSSEAANGQAAVSSEAAAGQAVSGGVATPGGTEIGWRLRRDPLMLVMVVSTAVVIAAIGGINVIEVFFIRETLEGSATTYGLVSAAWMAGMLPGTWLAVRLARRLDDDAALVRGVLATLAVCSLMVLLAATVPAAGVLVPLWLVGGAANGGENVFANLLTARRVPEAMRARAYASYGAAVQGGSMAGFLIGGALLAVVPPRPLIAGAGVVGLLVVLVFVPFVTGAARRSSSAGLATPGRPAEPEPAAGDTVGPWLSASHARGSGTSSS